MYKNIDNLSFFFINIFIYINLILGERFDVTIETNRPPGKYLVSIRGFLDCRDLRQEAFILYDNVKPESVVIKDEQLLKIDDYTFANMGHDCHEISRNFICSLDLKGLNKVDEINSNEIIYIPFDVNSFSYITDAMSDYRYNFYGCPFYPSDLSKDTNTSCIKYISFYSRPCSIIKIIKIHR